MCACELNFMCLCVVIVICRVMVHGLCLCVLCVCAGVSFNVLVCGVGELLFDVVWFAVVCDVLCVLCLFDVCALFVNVSNGVVWFAGLYYCLWLCVVCVYCVCASVCGVVCDAVGVCCCAIVMCLFVCVVACFCVCCA